MIGGTISCTLLLHRALLFVLGLPCATTNAIFTTVGTVVSHAIGATIPGWKAFTLRRWEPGGWHV